VIQLFQPRDQVRAVSWRVPTARWIGIGSYWPTRARAQGWESTDDRDSAPAGSARSTGSRSCRGVQAGLLTGALAGLRVVDLSRVVAGPMCAQMLADHGADVIKIEGPAGDELRTYGPPFGEGTSAYFDGINRNKRNICVDLSCSAGQDVVRRLLDGADVVIENFRTGTMDRWGLGYAVIAVDYPGIIYCRITGFGTEGPMAGAPGYDAVLQAYSGIMSLTGDPDGQPMRVGLPIVDLMAAMHAFSGILLALNERNRSQLGQLIDCTLLDAALSLLHPHASAWTMYGSTPGRSGNAHGSVAPYETFESRSGPVMLAANNNEQFIRLVQALGRPDLAVDPRFSSNGQRVQHRGELSLILRDLVSLQDAGDLSQRLVEHGVPALPVLDVPHALAQPQVKQREMIVSLGDYTGLGIPVKLGRTPGSIRRAPVRRGADTMDVLAELNYGETEARELLRSGAAIDHGHAAEAR